MNIGHKDRVQDASTILDRNLDEAYLLRCYSGRELGC